MGLSSEMNKVSAAINCAIKQLGGGDCWKPQSDFSPELLLGFYLGFFKGRSCRGGLCYPVRNYEAGGDKAGADLVAEVARPREIPRPVAFLTAVFVAFKEAVSTGLITCGAAASARLTLALPAAVVRMWVIAMASAALC